MTRAMVTSRVGSRSLESPSLGNLHNGFGEGREGHTCSALGKPEPTANATRLAPTLHNKRAVTATALRDRKERETSACSPSKPTARVENLTLSHRNRGLSMMVSEHTATALRKAVALARLSEESAFCLAGGRANTEV